MDRTPARTPRTRIAEPIHERSAIAVLTTWRRLRDQNEAAFWQQMREVLLADLNAAGPSRLVACGRRLQQRSGRRKGSRTGPSPVDRGRTRSKHHLITDGHCTPLTVILTRGSRNGVPLPLLDAIPPIRGRTGRPGAGWTRSPPTADTTTASAATRPDNAPPSQPSSRCSTLHDAALGAFLWGDERSFA